jgi:ComF family protein
VIFNLLFPRRCPICDEPVKLNIIRHKPSPLPPPLVGLICPACYPKISYLAEPTCLKCGKALSQAGENAAIEFCHDCAVRSHQFDRGLALFEYPCIAGSLSRFKYKGRQEYAEYYGAEIARILGKDILAMNPECLIPVPIHQKRLRSRGYNQATVLAKVISRHLGIPVADKLVARVHATAPLKNMNLEERQDSLKSAFNLMENDVKLGTVMIVDDIFTTGSTIDAIARELRLMGVNRIYFVALSIGKG